LNGFSLSRVGKELLRVVDVQENESYTADLKFFLEKQGLRLAAMPPKS
jgi:hypothetical protein